MSENLISEFEQRYVGREWEKSQPNRYNSQQRVIAQQDQIRGNLSLQEQRDVQKKCS